MLNQSIVEQPPILIVGLGKSGLSALNLLLATGISRQQIFTFDERSSQGDLRSWDQAFALKAKTVLVSPGVPLQTANMQKLLLPAGTILSSELSLAAQFLTSEKLIGITGSVGKSTCTTLLGEAFFSAGKKFFIGGNLGTPLAEYILNIQKNGQPRAEFVALELSSYQLENLRGFHFFAAAITSLLPNHLERYSSLAEYYITKLQLLSLTSGAVILNRNGGDLQAAFSKWSDAELIKNPIWTDRRDLSQFDDRPRLLGEHNLDNLALTFRLALELGLPTSCRKGLYNFPGLPHRIENLGSWNNIQFINDSKATTLESIITSLETVRELKPQRIHLLLGGRDKKLPWFQLANLAAATDLQFHFFGEARELIQQQSTLSGDSHSSLHQSLDSLTTQLKSGDTVLLSPGGTSLDEFANFEERGDVFRKWVETIRCK